MVKGLFVMDFGNHAIFAFFWCEIPLETFARLDTSSFVYIHLPAGEMSFAANNLLGANVSAGWRVIEIAFYCG